MCQWVGGPDEQNKHTLRKTRAVWLCIAYCHVFPLWLSLFSSNTPGTQATRTWCPPQYKPPHFGETGEKVCLLDDLQVNEGSICEPVFKLQDAERSLAGLSLSCMRPHPVGWFDFYNDMRWVYLRACLCAPAELLNVHLLQTFKHSFFSLCCLEFINTNSKIDQLI